MLVQLTLHSCRACDSESSYGTFIDIPLEDIRLELSPMACECGYFKEYKHTAVSFSDWRTAKRIAEDYLASYKRDLELERKIEKSSGLSSFPNARCAHLKSRIETIELYLAKIGTTPVPNHLFKKEDYV